MFKAGMSIAALLLLIPMVLQAGNQTTDFFQRTGKINVVVVVICIIFFGLAIFLFRMDRRITHLENQREHESKKN